VDEVIGRNSGEAQVAVVGDMNDGPESPVLRVLRASGEGALFDCTRIVDLSERFSLLHEGRRQQVDHVLATQALFSRLESARFLNSSLRDHGMPGRSVDADAMTVDSDHAALVVRFR
jgi:predicted extracellular nuclease